MFDTEKLIVNVEQRPCLWNLSEKSYSDKFLKQKAWQEVAENCFEEWNNLSNEDKENKSEYFLPYFYCFELFDLSILTQDTSPNTNMTIL